MPEAAIDEDGNPTARQHEVGSASLRDLAVQPEPPAGGMDRLAKEHLGSGVHLAPSGEVPATLGADPALRHVPNLRSQYPNKVPQ